MGPTSTGRSTRTPANKAGASTAPDTDQPTRHDAEDAAAAAPSDEAHPSGVKGPGPEPSDTDLVEVGNAEADGAATITTAVQATSTTEAAETDAAVASVTAPPHHPESARSDRALLEVDHRSDYGPAKTSTTTEADATDAAVPSGAAQSKEYESPRSDRDLVAGRQRINAAIRLLPGPAVVPPGSTVTGATSKLQLPCNSRACTVSADWYFPDDPNPKGIIYFQHGDLANAAMYSYTAADLAQHTQSIVVAPSVTGFISVSGYWLAGAPMQGAVADLFIGDRAALTASASAAAGHAVTLPERVVFVGHSMGGGLVEAAAGYMLDNGSIGSLAGVVLLDAYVYAYDHGRISDLVGGVPTDVPILLIAAPPGRNNNLGATATDLVIARTGEFVGVELAGGSHIDGMQGGNPITLLGESLFAGFSKPQNVDAVKMLASGWINDMFDGTHTGTYVTPGQTVQLPTDAGTATAIALPTSSKASTVRRDLRVHLQFRRQMRFSASHRCSGRPCNRHLMASRRRPNEARHWTATGIPSEGWTMTNPSPWNATCRASPEPRPINAPALKLVFSWVCRFADHATTALVSAKVGRLGGIEYHRRTIGGQRHPS